MNRKVLQILLLVSLLWLIRPNYIYAQSSTPTETPTSTPTGTITSTPTPTPTSGSTSTPTKTPTPTKAPTKTPTPLVTEIADESPRQSPPSEITQLTTSPSPAPESDVKRGKIPLLAYVFIGLGFVVAIIGFILFRKNRKNIWQ